MVPVSKQTLHFKKSVMNKIQISVIVKTNSEDASADSQNYDHQLKELIEFCASRNWRVLIKEHKKVKLGRPSGSSINDEALKKKYEIVMNDLKSGESIRKSAKKHGLSTATIQKLKNLL
jgi:hypothetical protein